MLMLLILLFLLPLPLLLFLTRTLVSQYVPVPVPDFGSGVLHVPSQRQRQRPAKANQQTRTWGCAQQREPLVDMDVDDEILDAGDETSDETSDDPLPDVDDDVQVPVQVASSSTVNSRSNVAVNTVDTTNRQRQQRYYKPNGSATPTSMWDESTVWAGNCAIVRRTDTPVGHQVVILPNHRIILCGESVVCCNHVTTIIVLCNCVVDLLNVDVGCNHEFCQSYLYTA